MIDVRNNGIPLTEHAPKASITQEIVGLSEALSGGKAAEADEAHLEKSSSSIGKLFGWGKKTPGK